MVAFLDIGGTELLLILGAALVLLGPKRLPEIARQFGKVSSRLRDANRELKRELYSNLEPPPAVGPARGSELESGVDAPRPAARNIEQGALAAPSAAASDFEAPYRDAEAELQRAGLVAASPPPATPPPSAPPATEPPAEEGPPPTQEADPDKSGSAS